MQQNEQANYDLQAQSQDAMAGDLGWYGSGVADAWEDQGMRSARGTEGLLGGDRMLNSGLDSLFGAINATAAPVMPFITEGVKYAAENAPETTQDVMDAGKWFSDTISDPADKGSKMLSESMGLGDQLHVSKDNINELMGYAIPVLGYDAAVAGVRAAAPKVASAGRKVAQAINEGVYKQGGELLPPTDPIQGWELTPEEAMARWDQIRSDSGQKVFPEDSPTLDEFNWLSDNAKDVTPANDMFDESAFGSKNRFGKLPKGPTKGGKQGSLEDFTAEDAYLLGGDDFGQAAPPKGARNLPEYGDESAFGQAEFDGMFDDVSRYSQGTPGNPPLPLWMSKRAPGEEHLNFEPVADSADPYNISAVGTDTRATATAPKDPMAAFMRGRGYTRESDAGKLSSPEAVRDAYAGADRASPPAIIGPNGELDWTASGAADWTPDTTTKPKPPTTGTPFERNKIDGIPVDAQGRPTASRRTKGVRQSGYTDWDEPSQYGNSSGFDKTRIYHNPDIKTLQKMANEAPYGELRYLVDETTGDVHFWPASHAFHNDAAKRMGIVDLDRTGKLFHGYLGKNEMENALSSLRYDRNGDMSKVTADDIVQQFAISQADGFSPIVGRERRPHYPGTVDPQAPGRRIAEALNRAPEQQVREEYPGVFTYRKPLEGEPYDPRNPLEGLDPEQMVKGYTQVSPGRYMSQKDMIDLRNSQSSGTLDRGTYMGRDVPDMTPEERAAYLPPDRRPLSTEEMRADWENMTGKDNLLDTNIETHGLNTGRDLKKYAGQIAYDGDIEQGVRPSADRNRMRRAVDRLVAKIKENPTAYKRQGDFDRIRFDTEKLTYNDLRNILDDGQGTGDLELPPKDYLKERGIEVGGYDGPIRMQLEIPPGMRGEPRKAWQDASIVNIDEVMPVILKYNDELMDAKRVARDKAWYDSLTPEQKRGEEYRKAFEAATRKPIKRKIEPGQKKSNYIDGKWVYDGYYDSRNKIADTVDDIDNMDMSVHNDGAPVYTDIKEPAIARRARKDMLTGSTRYDSPTMYGDSTGVPYTTVRHNPSVKDFLAVSKKSPYGEVRYLVDTEGDTHIWPAAHAYHDDVAEFLGLGNADEMIHGNMSKDSIKKVIESYNPDNIQQIVFSDQRVSRARSLQDKFSNHGGTFDIENWMRDFGDRNPVWTYEQARFENKLPKRRVGDAIDQVARTIEKAEPIAPKAAAATPEPEAPKWANAGSAEAEARARQRPRKKGEPSFNPKLGYTERQSKIADVDMGDGFDAAAAFDGNKDWSKVPVKDIHEAQRAALLDPKRPIPGEASAPKTPNMREAKKALDPEEAEKLLTERREVLGKRNEETVVKASTLGTSISKSVSDHIAMSPAQRAVNLRAAEETLAKAFGTKAGGKNTRLFTKNAKLLKAEKGYDGNQPKTPVTLPNGQGIETTGMALAPSSEMRGFKTCPNSASCRDACLGFKAGQYYQGGVDGGPQTASRKRTMALLDHPDAYGVVMYEEIAAARRAAIKNGNILGVRLNVLSDVDPKVYKSLLEAFPDVWFYDYTKMNYRPIAPNHHVTYSSTGVSNKDVTNLNQNWGRMRNKLNTGDNVAMAFTDKKSIPKFVLDEETGKMYRTVDGVGTDFRPGDLMETDGNEGVIVALKNMEQSTHKGVEHMETAGFLVPYDAKYKRTVSKTGKPGKYIRDGNGNMVPTSEIAVIPKQVSRKTEREKARVQITVKGKDGSTKDMSDYGGQSTGYTPDPSTAKGAGMFDEKSRKSSNLHALLTNPSEPASQFNPSDPNNLPSQLLRDAYTNRRDYDLGRRGPALEERTPRDWMPGAQEFDQRPFADDYPDAANMGMKKGQKLKVSKFGTPLEAKNVIGRRKFGEDDVSLSDKETASIAKYLLRDSPLWDKAEGTPLKRGKITRRHDGNMGYRGQIMGRVLNRDIPEKGLNRNDTFNAGIELNSAYPIESQNNTLRHEVGHGLFNESRIGKGDVRKFGRNTRMGNVDTDTVTPPIPDDIQAEMRQVFHESNAPLFDDDATIPYRADNGPFGNISPENHGYASNHNTHELFAEFFAAATRDPNYVKSVAPKAYEWMAKVFDEHPELRKVVQFNSPAAAGGLAAYLAYKMQEDQDQEFPYE
jgi:hypothetical protein